MSVSCNTIRDNVTLQEFTVTAGELQRRTLVISSLCGRVVARILISSPPSFLRSSKLIHVAGLSSQTTNRIHFTHSVLEIVDHETIIMPDYRRDPTPFITANWTKQPELVLLEF